MAEPPEPITTRSYAREHETVQGRAGLQERSENPRGGARANLAQLCEGVQQSFDLWREARRR